MKSVVSALWSVVSVTDNVRGGKASDNEDLSETKSGETQSGLALINVLIERAHRSCEKRCSPHYQVHSGTTFSTRKRLVGSLRMFTNWKTLARGGDSWPSKAILAAIAAWRIRPSLALWSVGPDRHLSTGREDPDKWIWTSRCHPVAHTHEPGRDAQRAARYPWA